MFLRNHDELTLEMVTDRERDYLWETYASDRRARINLGIRRRLAPLLQRDRRRIELMNGLLLSMPGTPVIYYGDEIAMGDNIHLGDRDGVRTPMQWSPDRNGGFSRSDPAGLVLPVIMDAQYGYDAVNVESQASDAHSLLNWTRRMLAVRQRHRPFGRGTQRFLYPGNRKVFAFLRELKNDNGEDDETILCVSNLSRTAQAVELDLSGFAGRALVDVVGGSVFPPASQLPYLLTLPPYAFYWFQLATQAQLPDWRAGSPEALPEFATLVIRRRLEEALAGHNLAVIETEILPAYLPKRRWFASKGEHLRGVRIAYAVRLRASSDPVVLAEIEARFEDRVERYALPLGGGTEDAPGPLIQQLALARLRLGREIGYLTDAFALDGFARATIEGLRERLVMPLPDGESEIRFLPTSLLDDLELAPDAEIRRLSAEQSNSSLVIGDKLVLKVVRRVLAGVHPEGEVTRYLTERGFANSAPLFGELVRIDADGTPNTFGLVQGFVRNQGDGWSWTLDFLARSVEEVAQTGADQGEEASDVFVSYDVFAAAIGKRLGELHAILASPTDQPDFTPEEVDEAGAESWAEGAIEQIDGAFTLLRATREWPDEATADLAGRVLDHEARLKDAALRARPRGRGIATHARARRFPPRTSARRARRRVHHRLRGGTRAADGAAAAEGLASARRRGPAALVRLCRRGRRAGPDTGFAPGRRTARGAAGAFPSCVRDGIPQRLPGGAARGRFALGQAERRSRPARPVPDREGCLRIRYEAANRPTWLGIPLHGLQRIIERVLQPAEGLAE